MWTMFSIFDGANECKMLVFISLLLAFITIGIFSIFHCGNFRSLRWKVDDIGRASHLDWPNSWSTAFRSICVRKPESCCDFPRKKKRSIIFVAVPPGEMPTHCSIQHKPPHTLRRSGVNVFHRLLLFHACCCLANCRVFVYHVKHSCYENVFSTPPNEQREENRKKYWKRPQSGWNWGSYKSDFLCDAWRYGAWFVLVVIEKFARKLLMTRIEKPVQHLTSTFRSNGFWLRAIKPTFCLSLRAPSEMFIWVAKCLLCLVKDIRHRHKAIAGVFFGKQTSPHRYS